MAGQMLQAGRPMRKPLPRGLPRPDYFEQRVFRVLWGPQSTYFSAAERQRFIGATFEVTKMRDRMGIQVRPDSGPVAAAAGLTIASDAINPGDFQVTGDGTPAILLADRGSSGGYPRIATLITADFPGLAQIPTGDSFQLHLISREEAVELLAAFRARLNALPRQMQPLLRDPRDIADLLAYNLIDGALRGDEYDGD
jgi:allophanate hydrolase